MTKAVAALLLLATPLLMAYPDRRLMELTAGAMLIGAVVTWTAFTLAS